MRTAMLLLTLFALSGPVLFAQETGTIVGRVTGEGGRGLRGAQVVVVESRLGAVTGADGSYTIEGVPSGEHRIEVTLIGHSTGAQTVQLAAGGTVRVDIGLEPQAIALEGVVAIGYGTQRRRDVTGSVASIGVGEVEAASATSVDQLLQGRAAGAQVTRSSGAPGGGVSVRIRGTNSITANSEPLYVIDGVPAFVGSGDDARQINPLADLAANDIESIEVLKDASATAIYGSRGANGVVLITTRRGPRGANTVRLDTSYGVQRAARTLDMLNAREYAELVNEAQTNIDRAPVYTAEEVASFGTGTNWQDEVLDVAPFQSHALTVTGGDDRTRYVVSGSYYDQGGIIHNSGIRRYSGRLNLDREVSGRFRIGTSLTLNRSEADRARTEFSTTHGVLAAALVFPPSVSVRDENGDYSTAPFHALPNPVATTNELRHDRRATRLLGNVFGEYDLTESLRVRSSIGGSTLSERGSFYAPSYIIEGQNTQGNASVSAFESSELVTDNLLTYRQSPAGGHDVEATAGFSAQSYGSEWLQGSSQQFATDITGADNLGAGALALSPDSRVNDWMLLSWLARVNYTLRDRYLLTVTGRYDGSSKFGAHNKWGFFPSAALAWRLSDEPFFPDLSAVSELKLRTSYGVTGNQEIGTYTSLARLGNYGYAWGQERRVGYAPAGLAPNADLKWESTRQWNLGVDLSLLNDRFTITADYYRTRTDDLLLSLPMPANTGYSSQLRNIGSVRNAGFELGISTVNVDRPTFSWRTSLNVATNRNEVADLGGSDRIFVGGGLGLSGSFDSDQVTVLEVGQPIGIFYGYRTDGVYQIGDSCALENPDDCTPGERRFVDVNGDGLISPEDRVTIGDPNPDVYGGITNSFSLGRVSLDVFFTVSYGNDVLNAMMARAGNIVGDVNQFGLARDRWTEDNPSNTVPRANNARPRRFADVFVEDGSFLRLQSLTIGYQLPERFVPGAEQAKVYLSGENLWIWTDYSGFDPEVNSFGGARVHRGIDNGAYPRPRTVHAGISVTF